MQYRASLKLDGKLPAHALMWRREEGQTAPLADQKEANAERGVGG